MKRLLPFAAAPAAMAGLAAAFTLGNAPAASHTVTDAAGQQSAANAANPGVSPQQVLSITQHPTTGMPIVRVNATRLAAVEPKGKHHRTQPAKYVVKSGDTLASIAQQLYQSSAYWPTLYAANHAAISSADAITAGQVLTVPAKPAKVPSAPQVPVSSSAQTASSSAASDTAQSAPVQTTARSASSSTGSSSSFQACVIAAESGGNAQVMNSSGHYGLYQFSAATWAAYGGNPADFGHASVAEQNRVFDNAIAAGGESNWAPYDGC
jgi:LysM repeat protein